MKRLWIGITILSLLLAVGIGTTIFATSTQQEISQTLSQASELALEGKWQEAKNLSQNAKQKWERYRKATASIADHEPMEEIDDLFSQMEIYLITNQPLPFSVCCASLSVLTEAIGEAHAVNWWSLL
jgi:sensor c-di-GMP phosphodiesterase-like protein